MNIRLTTLVCLSVVGLHGAGAARAADPAAPGSPSAKPAASVAPPVVTPVPAPPAPEPAAYAPATDCGNPGVCGLLCSPRDPRLYGGAEYLLWWVKGAPLAVPVVSTGPVSTTHHGLLGPPAENGADSTVLYGAPHLPAQGGRDIQNFGPFSGMRFSLGYAFGEDGRFAVEGSAFLFEKRNAGYQIWSDAGGNPVVGVPVSNSIPYRIGDMTIFPGEDSLPSSLPSDPNRARGDTGIITGGIKVNNSLRLWGSDVNGVVRLWGGDGWSVSGLTGFRYLDLSEQFNLDYYSTGISGMYLGQSGQLHETFQTRNHFYGGTIGLRGSYVLGRLAFSMTGRVALGSTHMVQNVWGGFQSINFPGMGFNSGPEGVFAQPANEGRRSGDRFAVVPEAQLKLAYAITPRLSATLGYDFLYWSNVMRPTDQINRELPKGQTFLQAAPVVSTTSPAPLFRTTDFFAHGLSVGLQFRY